MLQYFFYYIDEIFNILIIKLKYDFQTGVNFVRTYIRVIRSSEIFTFLSDRPLQRGPGRHVNSQVKPVRQGQVIVDGH